MKRAILSDIHGNFEALSAVLDDIEQQHVDDVCCLGDVVGYGPNPGECLAAVMKMPLCILGNHDEAVITEPVDMPPTVLRSIRWTRDQLNQQFGDSAMSYLKSLPRLQHEAQFLFVHGSPRDPTHEYVHRMDIHDERKMEALFEQVPQYCFQGHTHIPGVFTRERVFDLESCNSCYPLGDKKLMVNVGSVGQPRDGDPRACYAIIDQETVQFRRVEYPVNETVRKMREIEEVDDSFAERLLSGD